MVKRKAQIFIGIVLREGSNWHLCNTNLCHYIQKNGVTAFIRMLEPPSNSSTCTGSLINGMLSDISN